MDNYGSNVYQSFWGRGVLAGEFIKAVLAGLATWKESPTLCVDRLLTHL